MIGLRATQYNLTWPIFSLRRIPKVSKLKSYKGGNLSTYSTVNGKYSKKKHLPKREGMIKSLGAFSDSGHGNKSKEVN